MLSEMYGMDDGERRLILWLCRDDLARAERHATRALEWARAGRLDYAEGSRVKMARNLDRAELNASRRLRRQVRFQIVTRDTLATS